MRQLKISKEGNKFTPRGIGSIDSYMSEVNKYDLITPEEEYELAKLSREGDESAFKKLIESNLRFVISVAKQYQHQGLSFEDLINEGNLGLITAVKRFDETRGFKFISYAVWWIRQSILQALAENSRLIRIPLNKTNAVTKYQKIYAKLEQQYCREPSASEIEAVVETGQKEFKDVDLLLASRISKSFDDKPSNSSSDDERTMLDVYENKNAKNPEENVNKESLKKDVEIALQFLDAREKDILVYFFGLGGSEPLSIHDIAENVKFKCKGGEKNLTPERIRQLKEKALKKLKEEKKTSDILRQHMC